MPSPTSDDYARLKTPWQPLTNDAIQSIAGLQSKIKPSHETREEVLAETDSAGIINNSSDNGQDEHEDLTNTDGIDANSFVSNGAHEDNELESSDVAESDDAGIDSVVNDGEQIDGPELTDTENPGLQHADEKCTAVITCVANSGDHRKVVSHVFGRNKACTRQLPDHLWIYWCRKHYQRKKYVAEKKGRWHLKQLQLVHDQLQVFEDWGEIHAWNIVLRKAEHQAIKRENENGVTYTNHMSSCWERFLVPDLGSNKTFAQVRHVLEVIQAKFNEQEYLQRDKKQKVFPGVEFLPTLRRATDLQRSASQRGEVGYTKITLDQPAFKRRNGANREYVKRIAESKRETSSTTESSGSELKKKNKSSPDTDKNKNKMFPASARKKRKTPTKDSPTNSYADTMSNSPDDDDDDDITGTPFSKGRHTKRTSTSPILTSPKSHRHLPLPLPIHRNVSTMPIRKARSTDHIHRAITQSPVKRRRLTRGYERHGTEGLDRAMMEKEKERDEDDEESD